LKRFGVPATILHFGQELSDRFPLLRHAGYSIARYVTILEFQDALRSGVEHDAVSFSDLDEYTWPLAALAARTHSSAPLIFFRTRSVISFPGSGAEHLGMPSLAAMDFDLVVPPGAHSHIWIDDIAASIARSRTLLSQSGRLREELAAAGEKLLAERARARRECARNAQPRNAQPGIDPANPGPGPALPGDKLLICSHCGAEFVFSAGEQQFFQSRNFANLPMRCRKCRNEGRGRKPASGGETVVSCAACGISTRVPFRPTQGKPVFCRACFDRKRTGG
jgi:CxxC-x17-CxxC domain-containing protein